MKCPVCGSETEEHDKFCEICGKALKKAENPYRKIIAAAIILIGLAAAVFFGVPSADKDDTGYSKIPIPIPSQEKPEITTSVPQNNTQTANKSETAPILKVSQNNYRFDDILPGEKRAKQFIISNMGTGTLDWTAKTDRAWMELSRVSGKDNGTIIVTVNSAELNPGIYYGTVEISSNGGTQTLTIEFNVPQVQLSALTLSPASASIVVGNSQSFTATAIDKSGRSMSPPISWASSNTNVGTINKGLFTAISPGTTIITASSGSISKTASVTVLPQVVELAQITVSPVSVSMKIGDKQSFNATALDKSGNPTSVPISWTSSDTGVGMVDGNGLFTAIAQGTSTITASSGTISGTAVITVSLQDAISVSPATASILVGETESFIASDQYGNPVSASVSWTSSNTAVGTIDNNGRFTAIAQGNVTITASSGIVIGKAFVTVNPEPSIVREISIAPPTAALKVGETQDFSASAHDQHGFTIAAAVIWDSSDQAVGTIDSSGKFTAISAGSTTITASTGSYRSTASVTVTAPPLGSQMNDFVDTWLNEDPNTGGITKIEIISNGNNLDIHAYGACSPSDCDWGAVSIAFQGNPVTAIYSFSFKITELTITLVTDGRLHVNSRNTFIDGSNRDYTADYYFNREPGLVTIRPIDIGVIERRVINPPISR